MGTWASRAVLPGIYEVDHPFYALLHRSDIALQSATLDDTPIYRNLRPGSKIPVAFPSAS